MRCRSQSLSALGFIALVHFIDILKLVGISKGNYVFVFRERKATLHQPVWISAEVLAGPNSRLDPINLDQFIDQLNGLFPNVTVSLGWRNSVRWAIEANSQIFCCLPLPFSDEKTHHETIIQVHTAKSIKIRLRESGRQFIHEYSSQSSSPFYQHDELPLMAARK